MLIIVSPHVSGLPLYRCHAYFLAWPLITLNVSIKINFMA